MAVPDSIVGVGGREGGERGGRVKMLETKLSTIEGITPDIIREGRIFKLCPKRPSFKRDAIHISLKKKRRYVKTGLKNTMFLLTIYFFIYFIH